jgi:hypothetical protein
MKINQQIEKYNEKMKNARRIFFLSGCYVGRGLTKEEHGELDELIIADDEHMYLFELLTDQECIDGFLSGLSGIRAQRRPQKQRRKRGLFSFVRKIFK